MDKHGHIIEKYLTGSFMYTLKNTKHNNYEHIFYAGKEWEWFAFLCILKAFYVLDINSCIMIAAFVDSQTMSSPVKMSV